MKARNLADSHTFSSERDTSDGRIPLVIIGGFLGAGKTTVLNHLLQTAKGRRLAVLVNDVGEVNIDTTLIQDVAQVDSKGTNNFVELSNGCICCGVQDAFGEAITELAQRKPDCIVVEATGIAEPQRIVASLASRDVEGISSLDYIRIVNIITLIDAKWWANKVNEAYQPIKRSLLLYSDPRRPLSELLAMQVEYANVIILNKTDLVDSDSLRRSRAAAAAIAPSAEIIATSEGRVKIGKLLDLERFDISTAFDDSRYDSEFANKPENTRNPPKSTTNHNHTEFGLTAFVYKARSPISHNKLVDYLRSGIPGLLRAKGFAWTKRKPERIAYLSLAGDTLRFDYLGKWVSVLLREGEMDRSQMSENTWKTWDSETGDRRQEIVFIGIDLDRKAMERKLESFLLI